MFTKKLFRVAALAITVTVLRGCGSADGRVSDTPPSVRCGSRQFSTNWESGWPLRQNYADVEATIPGSIRSMHDTVFSVSPVDLDCDGNPDFVAQVYQSGTSLLVGYVNEDHGWRRVLSAPVVVEGSEVLVIAADLNADNMLDLVTWGHDEGGYVPRVFVSRNGTYRSLEVPEAYVLRQEELWPATCRRRVLPRLLPGNAIQLSRETISPASDLGHGADCTLPVDTFTVAGSRLQLADPLKTDE